MPLIRGRLIPVIEDSGRVKSSLDALVLCPDHIGDSTLRSLDELEILRVYLKSFTPNVCSIRLLVPASHRKTLIALEKLGIQATPVEMSDRIKSVSKPVEELLKDHPLKSLALGALNCDADCLVTDEPGLLAYGEDFTQIGMLLTSPDFLSRYAEVFVRGHDVPWAFAHKVWCETWTAFYPISESWTFRPAMNFFTLVQSKGSPDSADLVRSLAFNRLGDL